MNSLIPDQLYLELAGTFLIQLIFFWLPSLLFLSLPTLAPSFSAAHRIQKSKPLVTPAQIKHCAAVTLCNQLLGFVAQVLVYSISPANPHPTKLPTLPRFAAEVAVSLVVCELAFYYSHRALHSRRLYRAIHETHHTFRTPISLSAHYSHPVEYLVSVFFPVHLPRVVVQGLHWVSWGTFAAGVAVVSCALHSGYEVWGLAGLARRHDLHHEVGGGGFGTFEALDWVHGTGGDWGRVG